MGYQQQHSLELLYRAATKVVLAKACLARRRSSCLRDIFGRSRLLLLSESPVLHEQVAPDA
jgi:hypothetical protein